MVDFIWDNIFKKTKKENDIINILSKNILFKDLKKKELYFLEKIIHIRYYKRGEIIFRQGELGAGMYLIINGLIHILVEDTDEKTNSTKQILVTQLSKDDFFGELSLVEENGQRTATALAYTDSTLIGFFKPDLMEIIDRQPSMGIKIIFNLAHILGIRLIETTKNITTLRKKITQNIPIK